MANYYIEFGGGLGDIFYQIYNGSSYRALDALEDNDQVTVGLITHNPFASELFAFHPKAPQLRVLQPGYWTPDQDGQMRSAAGLPVTSDQLRESNGDVVFYASESDLKTIRQLEAEPFVVFSVSAGIRERNLPNNIIENATLEARKRGFVAAFVGRTYERHGREEYRPRSQQGIDLIDSLSVPGVANLLSSAVALVTCHSSVNMLGWLMRKPQLLLYPDSVRRRHIQHHDQWALGIDFPECHHTTFDDVNIQSFIEEFFGALAIYRRRKEHAKCFAYQPTRIAIPKQSEAIVIDENLARLTSARETKLLCWIAQNVDGNVVEIGCNKGLTTRDLSATNPEKIIYAVDYFGHGSYRYQENERPPLTQIGSAARQLTNVLILLGQSGRVNYDALRDVGLVIIDGDHTLQYVYAETECALSYFRRRGRGVLVWHDYYEGAPDWVGVKRVVDQLNMNVYHFEDTWVALCKIGYHDSFLLSCSDSLMEQS